MKTFMMAAVALTALAAVPAQAGSNFSFGFFSGVPAPVVYRPAPVVYHAPPRYYAPQPVYYTPYSYFSYGRPVHHKHGRGHGRGNGKHWH